MNSAWIGLAGALALSGASPAGSQETSSGPALGVMVGVITPSPLFNRGPEGARLGLHLESRSSGRWRIRAGMDIWSFFIGCDVAGSPCDALGLSVDGALAWYPLATRHPHDLFVALGLGLLRGPNRQFAFLPSGRAGVDLGARHPVALRLEIRFEPQVRHRVINAQGDRTWQAEKTLGFSAGLRIRLRGLAPGPGLLSRKGCRCFRHDQTGNLAGGASRSWYSIASGRPACLAPIGLKPIPRKTSADLPA